MTDLLPYMNLYPTRELQNPPEETTEAPIADPEVETDENGEPVTTEPQTGVFFEEDDFSSGIFGDPNEDQQDPGGEPEGQADPENED